LPGPAPSTFSVSLEKMSLNPDCLAVCLLCAAFLAGCSKEPAESRSIPLESFSEPVADTIYFGGDILTMNDAQPGADAVAVRAGKILAVGDLEVLKARSDGSTRWVDLESKTLLPGFFDSHSHLVMTAAKLAVVNLDPPPAGPADSIPSIQEALRQKLLTDPPAEGGWLTGWGYDHSMLAERRHPTRNDLDKVSRDTPIMLIHFSGHQIVINSRGLELAGIDASTEDPDGGRILRESGSRLPNGILQENAIYPLVLPILNKLTTGGVNRAEGEAPAEDALQRVDAALAGYAAQGFTTVTEMGATPQAITLLQAMSDQKRLELDVIAMALSKTHTSEQIARLFSNSYTNRLRVGGVKIILDGGSPGRSAWLLEPYHEQFPGENGYRGFPHFQDQAELDQLLQENIEAGNPLYIHALGDAAVGQAISALQAAGTHARTQLIHVQQAGEDQLDLIQSLGATLTFQVAHNYYFGDFHQQSIYGPERTARLNPTRSAMDRGISVSLHHDSPIHPVDQLMLIWAAVNRVTRSGQVIGETQRIPVIDALKASTINAAYQFYEEGRKGSIEVNKLADFVVLSDNPLTVDPMDIRKIKVLETIKEDQTVFRSHGPSATFP